GGGGGEGHGVGGGGGACAGVMSVDVVAEDVRALCDPVPRVVVAVLAGAEQDRVAAEGQLGVCHLTARPGDDQLLLEAGDGRQPRDRRHAVAVAECGERPLVSVAHVSILPFARFYAWSVPPSCTNVTGAAQPRMPPPFGRSRARKSLGVLPEKPRNSRMRCA